MEIEVSPLIQQLEMCPGSINEMQGICNELKNLFEHISTEEIFQWQKKFEEACHKFDNEAISKVLDKYPQLLDELR